MPGAPKHKKEAEQGFHAILADGDLTPEDVMIAVMRGQKTITRKGKTTKLSDKMYNAARDLISFRLPRLNAIDAVQKNVDMTHEDWLKSLDDDDSDNT